jgi:hypothetical protein
MRSRKTNPGIGTLLLIGTLTAFVVGGTGYVVMRSRAKKAKPKGVKKLVCDAGYDVMVVDGIEICTPIIDPKPSSPKKPSSKPADGQVNDDGELIVMEETDVLLPTPRSSMVSGTCPATVRDAVYRYMSGVGTAQSAVTTALERCGANSSSAKRQAILEFIVDTANANGNLAGSLDLRSYALSAMSN